MARQGENIRERKDGRWEGRYTITDPDSGRRQVKSVYARTYEGVKEKLLRQKAWNETMYRKTTDENLRIRGMNQAGTVLRPLSDAAAAWLCEAGHSKKYSTYVKYKEIYEKHLLKIMEETDMGSETQLQEKVQESTESLSDSLSKSIYCVANQIIAFCNLHYNTDMGVLRRVRSRTPNKPVKTLNPSEQAKLIRVLCDDMDSYKFGILLCLNTGLRLGEVCALKWSDIDITGKLLYVNHTVQRIEAPDKGSGTVLREDSPKSMFSQRVIPIPDFIMEFLKKHESDEGYVISGSKPTEPRTYQYRFRRILSHAGIEARNFHVLRHTFATNCIASGADVKSLSEILGHSSVNITLNRYVHPSVDTKRAHLNHLSSIYGQYMGQDVKKIQ